MLDAAQVHRAVPGIFGEEQLRSSRTKMRQSNCGLASAALVGAVLLLVTGAAAQTTCAGQNNCTAVTATITDSNSNVYANCRWNVQFSNTTGKPAPGQTVQFNGSPINPAYLLPQNGSCTAGGSFSVSLPANTAMIPTGTQWTFNIVAQDGITAFSSTQTITGASQSLSSALSTASVAQPCAIVSSVTAPSGLVLVGACGGGSGSGTVTPSPQYQLAYFPTAGSVATVAGSPSLTTDSTGDLTAAGSVTAGGAACPGCSGIIYLPQGTANGVGVASVGIESPVLVSSAYNLVLPGGGATGILYSTFSGSTATESFLTVGSGLTITGSTLSTTGGSGTVTSIATTGPISGGTITSTGTISCPTCLVNTLPSGDMFVGNGSNVATGVAISGDSSITNAGVMTNTGLNGTSLAGLATGILFNTTTTGVPSILTVGSGLSLSGSTLTATGLSNPMTTLGDIIRGGASGTPTRLGIGTTGQALIVSGGVPAWGTATAGAGGSNTQVQYNSSGTLAGNATETFDGTNNIITQTSQTNTTAVTGSLAIGDGTFTPKYPLDIQITGATISGGAAPFVIGENINETVTMTGSNPSSGAIRVIQPILQALGGGGTGTLSTIYAETQVGVTDTTSGDNPHIAGIYGHTRFLASLNVGSTGMVNSEAAGLVGTIYANSGATGTIGSVYAVEGQAQQNGNNAGALTFNIYAGGAFVPWPNSGPSGFTIVNNAGVYIPGNAALTAGTSINSYLEIGQCAAGVTASICVASGNGNFDFRGGYAILRGSTSATSGTEIINDFSPAAQTANISPNTGITTLDIARAGVGIGAAFPNTINAMFADVANQFAGTTGTANVFDAQLKLLGTGTFTNARFFNTENVTSNSGTFTNAAAYRAGTFLGGTTTYTNVPIGFQSTEAASAGGKLAGSMDWGDSPNHLACTMSAGTCNVTLTRTTYTAAACIAGWTGTGTYAGLANKCSCNVGAGTCTVTSALSTDTAAMVVMVAGY